MDLKYIYIYFSSIYFVVSASSVPELSGSRNNQISKTDNNPEFQNINNEKIFNAIQQIQIEIVNNYREMLEIKKDDTKIIRESAEHDNLLKDLKETIKQEVERKKVLAERTKPRSCVEHQIKNDANSGIRTIFPIDDAPQIGIEVMCNQEVDGGGWTIFQLRDNLPKRENFYRSWSDYTNGFGQLRGEFWMGLELLHLMTKDGNMELRVDLEDIAGMRKYAVYDHFQVEDSVDKYRLRLGSYSGTAGDSLSYHNNQQFSTYDERNDKFTESCAVLFRGGWWYDGCYDANLNGFQHQGQYEYTSWKDRNGIVWDAFRGLDNSMTKASMMFRPKIHKNVWLRNYMKSNFA